jgi:hypothetical protein
MTNVFVFGSNLAGRHGKGAAKYAHEHYGAVYGEGIGRTGNAYAIPTKDHALDVLALVSIGKFIREFVQYARENTDDTFLLTPIGTGLAGYDKTEIFQLIRNCAPLPSNIVFTKEWFNL